MSEIAIITARRTKLQMLAEDEAPGAKLALMLSENPTRALSTIQVGITSIGILSGIVGESALADPLQGTDRSFPAQRGDCPRVSYGVCGNRHYLFPIVIGELVPKRVGQIAADAIAKICR